MVDATPAIRTENLTRRFGDLEAVSQLDLAIPQGEVYGCLGLNGAGKTTTVRMLAGALPPTEGQAYVLGHDVRSDHAAIAHEVGVVFGENITPEPGFSPIRYLRHFGGLYGIDRDEVDDRARELFDVLELHPYAEQPIQELSGGNKRKVEIARALLHGPRVLFLDEPTRELDIPSKRETWSLIQNLTGNSDVTVFLSSHDVREIATLCDRIGILREGRKTWEGRPAELTTEQRSLVDALGDRLEGPNTEFQPAGQA
jgi:ABC-2 type transport system ATP-binding protein